MSNLYCKTKSGKIFKIWSDNTEEETMNVYPADEQFDAESTNTQLIKYSEIDQVDSNLAVLQTKEATVMITDKQEPRHQVKPIDTPEDDKEFGVQMVEVTSDNSKVDFAIRINGSAQAELPCGKVKTIKRYNNGLAFIENTE